MTNSEKTEILDNLEYELVKSGFIDLSFSLEDFSELDPENRWREVSLVLKNESLPESLSVFKEPEPDWNGAKAAFS